MKSGAITVRVPAAWAGRVSSQQVRGWLVNWFRHPVALPEDPGAGDAFLRLSLPQRAVRTFAAQIGDEPSAALRRLIRTHLGLPAARPIAQLASARATTQQVPKVEILSKPALPAVRVAEPERLDMMCIRCHRVTLHQRIDGRWDCLSCRDESRRYLEAQRRAEAEYERQRKALQMEWWGWQRPARDLMVGHDDGLVGWWRKWGLLIIAAFIVVGILVLRRKLVGKPVHAAIKPVAMPVREGFVVWLPKQ